jgi:glycosyltransferase involved in cell wall biosynthesis
MTFRRRHSTKDRRDGPLRRVGLNAVFLQSRMGGLGAYATRLPPALLEARPDLRLSIFVNELGREVLAGEPWADSVEFVTHPLLGRPYTRAATELTLLGSLASRHELDLLHSIGLTGPLRTRPAHVLTVADVIWLREPESVGRLVSLAWRSFVPLAARRADRLITFSAHSRGEISEDFRVPRERIDVVPLGPGLESNVQPTPEVRLRSQFALGKGPIILAVSALSAHKNLGPLIEGMPAVHKSSPDAVLVLPGNPTRHGEDLAGRAAALGLADAIRFPGWVDASDLEGLYRAAECYVIPSRHEGFGLPILEAMARGVPVACARASALPEVAGDAALYFDPGSPDQIAAAVTRLLVDREFAKMLVARGHARQQSFTWRRTAEGTLESYERALKQRRTRSL